MAGDSKRFRNFEALQAAAGAAPPPAVLVLGGSTFMGRALVERLVARPARVCVVNRGRSYWGTDDPSCGRAARLQTDRRNAAAFGADLAEATRRLGERWALVADFSAYNGADMRAALDGLQGRFDRYAYISSDSVYEVSAWASDGWLPRKGCSAAGPSVAEPDSARPGDEKARRRLRKADSYGDGKLEAEEALAAGLAEHAGSGRCVSCRLPDVIGPFDDTYRLWAFWHWLHAGPEEPPQVARSVKRPRRSEEVGPPSAAPGADAPDAIPLAFVFSQDVARFIDGLLDEASPAAAGAAGSFDAVNLMCREQVDMRGFLALLATASSLKSPPRLAAVDRPRSFLPSVDRPWQLSCSKLDEVYKFTPTPLPEVLSSCAEWFTKACKEFPRDALRAAMKLPPPARKLAIQHLGLTGTPSSSSASDSSSDSS